MNNDPRSLKKQDALVNSFWHGGALTWIERACMRSFLKHGTRFRLYTYGDVTDIPSGVEVIDAETVIPKNRVFTFQGNDLPKAKGSYAIFSDLFRYELQRQNAGLWVDCDVYCIKPFRFENQSFVFAYQSQNAGVGSVANGVLKLPAGGAIVKDLIALFKPDCKIPLWVPERHRNRLLEEFGTDKIHPKFLPWGSTGPKALTALVWKYGREEKIMGRTRFYPIWVHDLDKMFDPSVDVIKNLSPETFAIHLWNNEIRHRAQEVPPEHSFAHRLWLEGQ